MRELDFIDWIRSRSDFDRARVPVGPGDDAAVVNCGDEQILVATDQVLDGVHFILAEHGPVDAGRFGDEVTLAELESLIAAQSRVDLIDHFKCWTHDPSVDELRWALDELARSPSRVVAGAALNLRGRLETNATDAYVAQGYFEKAREALSGRAYACAAGAVVEDVE